MADASRGLELYETVNVCCSKLFLSGFVLGHPIPHNPIEHAGYYPFGSRLRNLESSYSIQDRRPKIFQVSSMLEVGLLVLVMAVRGVS